MAMAASTRPRSTTGSRRAWSRSCRSSTAAASLLEDGGEGGQGSGFVVDGDGYIATNAHVVTDGAPRRHGAGGRGVRRVLRRQPGAGDDRRRRPERRRRAAEGRPGGPVAHAAAARPLGDSIAVGEPVAAIGSPFGERQSLSVGVISALDRTIQSLTRFQIGDAIQTDAAINPGNSGGPLLDARGRVIGINAQIRSQSGGGEGVGFAIPVDTVRRSLRELRDQGTRGLRLPRRRDAHDLAAAGRAAGPRRGHRARWSQDVVDGSPAEDAGHPGGRRHDHLPGPDGHRRRAAT